MLARAIAAIGALVAALAASPGCTQPGRTAALPPAGALRGANVLFLTIDTLRADRIGAYGAKHPTPTLDALAARGARFSRAYAHAVMTLPSHASLLTGLVPPRHGIRTNGAFRLPAEIDTVPERLRSLGYRTGAFVGAFVLDRRFGLDQGFDTYDDVIQEPGGANLRVPERPAADVLSATHSWLRAPDERPWFAWVHLFDPHTPYAAPPRSGDPYTDEVLELDAQLGRFLDALRSERKLEHTLVIVTADHGESLGEHGEATHGLFAYESTLRVPLILAGPQIAPAVLDRPVSHVELTATLLGLTGAPTDGLDGEPLQAVLAGGAARRRGIYFESLDANVTRGWAPLLGLVEDRWKYIDLPIPELYDIDSDPAEARNLAPAHAERSARMARTAREWVSGTTRPAPAIDAGTADRLRSLGYAASVAPQRRTYTAADDPKTLLPLHRQFMDALDRGERGDVSGAVAQLRGVIVARRDFVAAYTTAAALLIGSNQPREAVQLLEEARRLGLAAPEVNERLGTALLAAGEPRRALEILREVVGERPDNVDAWNALAVASMQTGRAPDARRALKRALDLSPSSAGLWTNLGFLEVRTGKRSDAAAAFRRATELDPGAVEAWRGLGAAALSAGDVATAAGAWKKAVEREPADAATLFNLSVLLAEHAPAEAVPYLERFLRLPETTQSDRARIAALLQQVQKQETPGAPQGARR